MKMRKLTKRIEKDAWIAVQSRMTSSPTFKGEDDTDVGAKEKKSVWTDDDEEKKERKSFV